MKGQRHVWGGVGLVVVLGLGTASVLPAGCASEQKSLKKKEQDKDVLKDTAEAYWHAVRWEQLDQAMPLVEEGPERKKLLDYLVGRRGKATISEVDVYLVELASEGGSGTVYVTYQLLLPNQESVIERRLEQTWTFKAGHWTLKVLDGELSCLD